MNIIYESSWTWDFDYFGSNKYLNYILSIKLNILDFES